jgi:PTS system mannose-specific IID component
MTPESGRHARVSRGILTRVFLRSLLIQSGFNPRLMQGLGLTFALAPALKALHPDEADRTEALRRHLVHFNTHPTLAAAIIGAMVRLEERLAAGEATPQEVASVRGAFAAPLAALGDSFFWDALRPTCALLAALSAPWLGLWAVAVFLLSYNAVHLGVRIWLFRRGYEAAEGLIKPIKQRAFPVQTQRLRVVAALLAGGIAGTTLGLAWSRAPSADRPGALVLCLAALLFGIALAPRVRPAILALGALAFGLLGGLLL